MSDVSIDIAVLHTAAQQIRTAGRDVADAGEPDAVGESAAGPGPVAAELGRVRLEQSARAATVGEELTAAGSRPAAAAREFSSLDRGVL